MSKLAATKTNFETTENIDQKNETTHLTEFLSENSSDKDRSSKISCGGRSANRAKPFQRTKRNQIIYRKNHEDIESPVAYFISPERSGLGNTEVLGSYGRKKVDEQVRSDHCWTSREHYTKINFFQKFGVKPLGQSTLNLREAREMSKIQQNIEKIKQLQEANRMQGHQIIQLRKENCYLVQDIERLKKIQQESDQERKKCIEQKNKTEMKILEQKQINECLEYIIEGLNKKIEDLLNQLNTIYNQQSPIRNFLDSSADFSVDFIDQQEMIGLNSKKEDSLEKELKWLQEKNQSLEHQNAAFKKVLLELRKDCKHFEFEASMTKKIRDQLTLQKSLRESFENRNKVLNEKIKYLSKQLQKSNKNIYKTTSLQDSLQFSFDFV